MRFTFYTTRTLVTVPKFELAPKPSNPFLRGWTLRSGKTADAIVFGVKYCSRRDRSPPCHSTIFSRKPRKTRFSGHFLKIFQPPITPEICVFSQNAPVKRCSVTVKLQSQFYRFSISDIGAGGGLYFFNSIDVLKYAFFLV